MCHIDIKTVIETECSGLIFIAHLQASSDIVTCDCPDNVLRALEPTTWGGMLIRQWLIWGLQMSGGMT